MSNEELSSNQTVLSEQSVLCAHIAPRYCGLCDERFKPRQTICFVERSENTYVIRPPLLVWRDCYKGINYPEDPEDLECKFLSQGRKLLVSPRYPLVHESCFPLFSAFGASNPVNDRLWGYALAQTTICHRRWPFRQPGLTGSLLAKTYLDSLSLGRLLYLPAEVVHMIHSFSYEHRVWRWLRCLELFEFVKVVSPELFPKKESHRLSSITRWQRGANISPITIAEENRDNFVLLIYDDRGLFSITQYCEIPENLDTQSAESLYILDRVANLTGMTVDFNYGFAHFNSLNLTFTKGLPFIPPPNLRQSNLQPIFNCIQTRHCTGITVMFVMGRPMTFHAHSPRSPYALQSWTRHGLDESGVLKGHVWIYIPFIKGDQITHFGVAHAGSRPKKLLFNFEKSGLYELGAGYQPKDNWAIQSVPDWPDFAFTLPHWQTHSTTEHISLLSQGVDTDCLIDRLQGPDIDHMCFEGTAPLWGVSSATVYERGGFCQGIHFIYEDSRQRTIGQCRIGMDHPVIYEKPLRLLWTCQEYEGENRSHLHLTGLKVKFSVKKKGEEGWKARVMEGHVIFRMTKGIADLSFAG